MASSSAGQALRLLIAWMWSIGWSGSYMEWISEDILLCVHNLSRAAQAVELDLHPFAGRVPVEMFGRTRFPAVGELPYLLTLAPRGFFWFQLVDPADEVDAGA